MDDRKIEYMEWYEWMMKHVLLFWLGVILMAVGLAWIIVEVML